MREKAVENHSPQKICDMLNVQLFYLRRDMFNKFPVISESEFER